MLSVKGMFTQQFYASLSVYLCVYVSTKLEKVHTKQTERERKRGTSEKESYVCFENVRGMRETLLGRLKETW